MASDLLSIASSGAKAARVALDVTAQNIANASSEGYVRRSVELSELSPTTAIGQTGETSLSGVRLDRVTRNVDLFRLAEARRTTSDASRANAELSGLENVESAIENARVYDAIVDFEGALEGLTADPTNLSLRASVLESAQTLARSFNVASTSLDAVGDSLHFDAAAGVDEVNLYAQELARINLRLTRAQNGSTDQSSLLDQRDLMLQKLSEHADVSVTVASDYTVEVRLGSGGGVPLVQGGNAALLESTTAADGTLSLTVGGSAVTLSGGDLAGQAQALVHLRDYAASLDDVVNSLIAVVNGVQTNGAALDGSAGQALFTGTGAAGIAVALSDPAALATAAAGSAAGSRDASNLAALRDAMTTNGVAAGMNAVIFSVSSKVSGLTTTRDALDAIASSASIALQSQAGVDLDYEAVNLIRFQQAFQASGRAMQVATDIFDTLLAIK
ncbi:MAG: flagellar hook-associated protein FlgK [Novosphingobium sp.]|nr:flagellar hook-associated protein FlgK [Novosphingobium sp.]